MSFIGITILVFLKFLPAESRMLPMNYVTIDPNLYTTSGRFDSQSVESGEESHEKVIGLQTPTDEHDSEEYFDSGRKHDAESLSKPCAVVVLSNMQNPNMQSLLRKYKYDAKGVLIPSSVKYFIKLPQGIKSSPMLVPLNDKAFSPLGGFVRYYKEVPPIPRSW